MSQSASYAFDDPYTIDVSLAEEIVKSILEQNTHLHRGDTLLGPVGLVDFDGTLVTRNLRTDEDPSQFKVVTAEACRVPLPFNGKFAFKIPKNFKFIHLYNCRVLKKIPKVGDCINTVDENFNVISTHATEADVARYMNAIFRFAVS